MQKCFNSMGSCAGKIRYMLKLISTCVNNTITTRHYGQVSEPEDIMLFEARQLQEKGHNEHRDLRMTCVNLTKAFDTVSREGLKKVMKNSGCPKQFTSMV